MTPSPRQVRQQAQEISRALSRVLRIYDTEHEFAYGPTRRGGAGRGNLRDADPTGDTVAAGGAAAGRCGAIASVLHRFAKELDNIEASADARKTGWPVDRLRSVR